MSKTKKVFGALMALALIFNVFAVVAFAAETDYTQTWALGTPTKISTDPITLAEVYTVDVNLTTNYGVGVIQFKVDIGNSGVLTLASVAKGAGYPYGDDAEVKYNAGTGYVTIIPQPGILPTLPAVTLTNAAIATLTFTYTGTGLSTVGIANDPKTDANPTGTLIAARVKSGDLISTDLNNQVYGQTAVVGSPVSIGVPPTPVLSGKTSNIIIDTTKTCNTAYTGAIYGFTGSRITAANYNCLTDSSQLAITNGTVEVTRGPGGYGTGTTLAVKDTSGAVVATYVIIIFGDIDGNGSITAADVTALVNNTNTAIPAKTPAFMAANIASAYNRITAADTTGLVGHFTTALNQHTIGALHIYSN